jgi:hypothetical protein
MVLRLSGPATWLAINAVTATTSTRHYFCCDKTVEGEGNCGMPDGWCFDGMHMVGQVTTLLLYYSTYHTNWPTQMAVQSSLYCNVLSGVTNHVCSTK